MPSIRMRLQQLKSKNCPNFPVPGSSVTFAGSGDDGLNSKEPLTFHFMSDCILSWLIARNFDDFSGEAENKRIVAIKLVQYKCNNQNFSWLQRKSLEKGASQTGWYFFSKQFQFCCIVPSSSSKLMKGAPPRRTWRYSTTHPRFNKTFRGDFECETFVNNFQPVVHEFLEESVNMIEEGIWIPTFV